MVTKFREQLGKLIDTRIQLFIDNGVSNFIYTGIIKEANDDHLYLEYSPFYKDITGKKGVWLYFGGIVIHGIEILDDTYPWYGPNPFEEGIIRYFRLRIKKALRLRTS